MPGDRSHTGSVGPKVCRGLSGGLARREPEDGVGFVCWVRAAGGRGCTLTVSHDFSPQTVVNRFCDSNRCEKPSALALLCSVPPPTWGCEIENRIVSNQRIVPCWCISYKSAEKLFLFWKWFNLLKLLTLAKKQVMIRYTETEVWLIATFATLQLYH